MSALVMELQTELNERGFGPLTVDGQIGPVTKEAIKRFQKSAGLAADGLAGPNTRAALGLVDGRPAPAKAPSNKDAQLRWPLQRDMSSVFGAPGNPACTAGVVKLPAKMRIAWDTSQTITSFRCHKLVAESMEKIFAETVTHYGADEWRRLGLDLFGGCYNLRKMRGGSSYSMHSWGVAVDIDPARNQLKWGRDKAVLAKPEYKAWWDIVEANGAVSLGRHSNFDWMHFQFARL